VAHSTLQHLNRNYVRPLAALLVAWLMAFPGIGRAQVQPAAAPMMLMITLVEGEGAINNIRRGTAREPIVQVTDENHKPVAGASVVFALPDSGSTGAFANGGRQLTVLTNNQGRAVAKGIHINNTPGSMKIQVTATKGQASSSQPLVITQTNLLGAHLLLGLIPVTTKSMVILGVVAAGVAGGATAAVLAGGSSNKISVGAPHF